MSRSLQRLHGWSSHHDLGGRSIREEEVSSRGVASPSFVSSSDLSRPSFRVIFFGAAVMTAGAIIQTAAFGLPVFIVGRIGSFLVRRLNPSRVLLTSFFPFLQVTGFGNGFITASVPVWQSECAKAEDRGYLVMIEGALSEFSTGWFPSARLS